MTTDRNDSEATARTEISGGHQDVVITAGNILGPVTITSAGVRVPAYLQDPERWLLVEAWGALTAGAHRARPDDSGSSVPPYVVRDTDAELQERLNQAVEQGGLVLVLGESTAGKTRAAHHAVRSCPALAGYRILAPDTGPDLVIAVDVIAATGVRCLVWLDDLERFLTPDGLEAGVLAELTRLKTPVLATMQARHHDALLPHYESGKDEPGTLRTSGIGSRVLKQTEPIYLQRRWSEAELARAESVDDPRIVDAVAHHGLYGVAEYLAAGPALLTEWRNAIRPGGSSGGHPRGAALVAAAIDLARTGLRPPFPAGLLTTLHEHYLPDDPLLRAEPVEAALSWATQLRYGVAGLLLPTDEPDAYRVFDYLPDHITDPVTEHAWQTALNYTADDDERFRVGVLAYPTAPHIAEAAWRPLVPRNRYATSNLGVLLGSAGRIAEAEVELRKAMEAGLSDAAVNLGILLAQDGRTEEAETLYREAASAGNSTAAFNLGFLLAEAGRSEEAEPLLRQAAAAGNVDAAFSLGILLSDVERSEKAEPILRQAAAVGHITAIFSLGVFLTETERFEEAEPFLRKAAAAGHPTAVSSLGIFLAETGRTEEAEPFLRQAAAAGSDDAACNLGILLAETGRPEEGERLLRKVAATGHGTAAANLGILLAQTGRTEEAKSLYRQAAAAGNVDAAANLAILLIQTGRTEEAEPYLRQAAAGGYADAVVSLGILLAQAGKIEEAENLLRQAADTGHTTAAVNLGILLAQSGRAN
ncbi:tetratricopeptide repeat protein [Streptomyces sp. NPDC057020]|uniref:tetratricopeptide repeat protein n=1 Tax=Streptomyces sp. NPDC057020 TaxID=3346002 RepID=UPI003625E93B